MLLATPFALATIVAVPTTSASLRNGTTTMPVPARVVAAADFAPSGVKRPLSVVKVTMMPSGEGFPAELIKVAVIVVELVPSAISDVSPVASVMPPISTMTGPAVGGGVVLGGVVLGGVVLGGVVFDGVLVDDDPDDCPPPPPAFSHPVRWPAKDTRHTDTATQPYCRHPCLSRTYGYLLR
jgi:hypothetical protein